MASMLNRSVFVKSWRMNFMLARWHRNVNQAKIELMWWRRKKQDKTGEVAEETKSHLQKMGFVRFNPFSDTGGDQSFCLAILDGQDNGIVISSLHSREQTRVYAKEIVAGKPKGVELSKEEREALKKATQVWKL